MIRPLLPLAVLGYATACTAPAPVNDAGVVTTTPRADWSFLKLGPNDIVEVDVLGHPELGSASEGVRVDAEGNLYLPAVGAVHVDGMSVSEANTALREAYGAVLLEPLVSASVREYSSREFSVLGNVANPGTVTMDRPVNALEALAKGGAFTRGADRESIFLLRPHGETMEVHAFNAATPDRNGLVRVMPGDIIYVRQRGTQDFQEDLLPIIWGVGATTLTTVNLAN